MIVVFPAVTPDTTPVDEFTVATAVLADDQVPPLTGCDNVVVEPVQNVVVPAMPAGVLSMVNWRVALQPMPETLYVIMVVPVATADIRPVEELIVAIDVLLLAHVPPAEALVHVAVLPRQITSLPEGAVGCALTVMVL